MKGTKVSGRGLAAVTVTFNLNELYIINELCNDIMKGFKPDQEITLEMNAAVTLAEIIHKIPEGALKLEDTYGKMTNDKDIFSDKVEVIELDD